MPPIPEDREWTVIGSAAAVCRFDIRQLKRLWRACDPGPPKRGGGGRRHAYRLIEGADVATLMGTAVHTPPVPSERIARELARGSDGRKGRRGQQAGATGRASCSVHVLSAGRSPRPPGAVSVSGAVNDDATLTRGVGHCMAEGGSVTAKSGGTNRGGVITAGSRRTSLSTIQLTS